MGVAERAQLHRAVGEWRQPQRNVDALPHQVDTLVGQAEIDRDVGISVLERENETGDVQDAERGRAGQSDGAGCGGAGGARFVAGLLDQAQDLDAVGVIAAAFIGQRHPSRGAAEQRYADSLLQLLEVAADRRLPDAQLPRDRRQAAALGNPDESSHMLQADRRFIHIAA